MLLGIIVEGEEVNKLGELEEVMREIDDLGKLREDIKSLKEREEKVKKSLEKRKLGIGTHLGYDYSLAIVEVAMSPLDPEKVEAVVGHDRLMTIINVVKKDAERIMTKEQMDTCSGEPTIVLKYTTRSLK